MRVTTTLFALLFFFITTYSQENNIKEKLGDIELQQIKDGVCTNFNFLQQTSGKITIIEFWETWCGPCIEGMSHLNALKSKFPNSLKIVCVSSDNFEKTTDFIAKNDFPFDFIYDGEKNLSKIFPHTGIPHTILIDKKGIIQAETFPGYVTEQILSELNNDNQVNLPAKKNFVPSELGRNENKNSLITFELQRHELGERNYIETTSNMDTPVQIINGYSAGMYYDTLETINGCVIAGKNALQIYQYAYNNIPISRFSYDSDLSYLDSHLPNHLYKMNFSCSSLLGNYQTILINQLNSVFGLETKIIEKEVEILVLDSIDTNNEACKESSGNVQSQTFQYSYKDYILSGSGISVASILKSIEDKISMPVESKLEEPNLFDLNIAIKDEKNQDINVWINHFKKNGLILRQDKKLIQFVKIEKAAHSAVLSEI
jgi:thiol-disulfide isomerase/thioredoxin